MSTAQGAHDGGAERTPSAERPEPVLRGLMRPTSLAVIVAFAAVGAALPLAFDHGSLSARAPHHAAIARPIAAPGTTLPRSGGPGAEPVSAGGFDAGWGILTGTDSPPTATTAPAIPAAPAQPGTAGNGSPPPPLSPTPSPLVAITTPSTPLGSAGVEVDGTAPTSPTSATVTAPVTGSVTVTNPLAPAPALP